MQKKEVKAILFDLDGVLIDSVNVWFYIYNDTLKHFGIKKISKKKFVSDFGAPIEEDIKEYFKGKTVDEVKKTFWMYFKKRRKLINKDIKLMPNSVDTLKILKNYNMKLGLITNSSKLIAMPILNHFRLKSFFKVIVAMEDVKRRKPEPDMILKACRKLKVSPQETILIGDTQNDMVAGKRAGCITIGYKTKGNHKIENLKEILSILNQKI